MWADAASVTANPVRQIPESRSFSTTISLDGMEPLFREACRAIVSKELNPIFDALFDDDSRFSPELELLRNEARAYDRDMARARKSIVSVHVGLDFEDWYATLQRLPLHTSSGEKNPAHWSGSRSRMPVVQGMSAGGL